MKTFSSKISSLQIIKKKLKSSKYRIPKFIFFSKNEYLKDREKIFLKINKNFKKEIIIRSSSLSEDTENFSNAGKFKSFSNIVINKNLIFDKIDEVIKEFDNKNDEVIIQHFEKKIDFSGVIFTRDQNTNAPYYTVNYDKSGRTDLVTSGKFNPSIKTLIIFNKSKKIPKKFLNLIDITKKIEKIFNNNRLDIEFGIEKKTNKILIFQCRKLFKFKNFKNLDKEIEISINNIKKKIIKLKKNNPYLSGKTTLFSNMADWNPAEMIGSKPKNLATSLYSELITNRVWSIQRKNYGYKNVYPNNLMVNFAGSPFIDIRTDFNSFLPKNLNSNIENKVIDNFVRKLQTKPQDHDKVEFNIIPTCYGFDEKTENYSLSKKNLKIFIKEQKKLTFNILKKGSSLLIEEKNKLNVLNNKIKIIKDSKISPIQKIFYLVNDCKEFGTLPFAGIARCAFITTKIIKTLVKEKIISTSNINKFFNNLDTITKDINYDYKRYLNNRLTKIKFIEKYGHLRPHTYSIISPNYKDGFNEYFPKNTNKIDKKISKNSIFKLKSDEDKKIKKFFKKHGLVYSPKDFFIFAKESLRLREWSKFIFSKSINEIFNNLEILSKQIQVSKNDLEFLSINTILNYNSYLDYRRIKNLIKREILEQKKALQISEQIKLPDLIINEIDLEYFYLKESEGNYVTDKFVTGKIFHYKSYRDIKKIKDNIVLIENADPGYDFLFSKKITGLITKFGGANSHMAIRCMELQIPAIIGIGEKNFDKLQSINTLHINCEQKNFKIIN